MSGNLGLEEGGREGGEEEVYCIVWLFEKKNNYKTREEDLIPTMVFFAEDEFVLLHGFHQDRMDHCVTRARHFLQLRCG